LAFAFVSLNGNGYSFNNDFTIASYAGSNVGGLGTAGNGFFGNGTVIKAVVGAEYQLNYTASALGTEPQGTIRFERSFSTVSWQSQSNEDWNGFTVGIPTTSAAVGKLVLNGLVGNGAALGAVAITGGLDLNAAISNAASLSVTSVSDLGASITTSGNQAFTSSLSLSTNASLTTTASGNVSFGDTVNGARNLTVATNGTGSAAFTGTVGGSTALQNLSVTTDTGTVTLASVTAANLTVASNGFTASATASNKTYDGNADATLSATSMSGLTLQSGSNLSVVKPTTGSFANANAGTGKAVTSNAFSITGYNGVLASDLLEGSTALTATTSANITTKALTITGMAATSRVYDGTSVAALTGGTLSGLISGETLSFSGQSGAFADKNVGAAKAVTVSGTALADGTGLASNYSITNPTGLTASITAKALTVTATGTNKVYDGLTTDVVSLAPTALAGTC